MIRVNPERARRYQRRTLAEPPRSITLTEADKTQALDYQYAWERNQDHDLPLPRAWDWWNAVQRYAAAKGIQVERMVQENHADLTTTLSWKPRTPL